MNHGNWAAIGDVLHTEAELLAAGSAELIVLATNTMHKLRDQIMQGIDLPFIHIAEATATGVLAGGSKRLHFSRQNSRCKSRFTWIFCATMALTQLC